MSDRGREVSMLDKIASARSALVDAINDAGAAGYSVQVGVAPAYTDRPHVPRDFNHSFDVTVYKLIGGPD